MTGRLFATLALIVSTSIANADVSREKQVLSITRDSWIGFRIYNGQQLVYFTHLEAWRCGIARVRYSINSDALDREWTLQPCEPANPNAVTTDRPYVALPTGSIEFVTVELTFSDGTKSDLATYYFEG